MHWILGKFQSLNIWCTLSFLFSTGRSSTLFRCMVRSFFCCSHMFLIIVLTDSFEPFLRLEIAPFTRAPTSRRINIGVIKDRAVNQKMLLHSLNSSPQRWPTLSAPLNRGRNGQVLDDWILWNVTCLRLNAHCWGRTPVSPLVVSISATPALGEEVAPRGLMFNKPPDHPGLADATVGGGVGEQGRSSSLKK